MADTSTEPAPFEGFSPDALQFLADLAANNDRAWFKPRKADYERLIKEPLEALCAALADRFDELRLPLEADPKRSPFRIYRDVRFSKDKSPYKTAQGADFPWIDSRGDDRAAARSRRWLLPSRARQHLRRRRHVASGACPAGRLPREDRPRPQRGLPRHRGRALPLVFGSVTGETLTRNPKGFPSDHPYGHLLRLKDVVFSRPLSDQDVYSPKLPEVIAHDLAAARPVLLFLDQLAGPPERTG